MTQGLLYYCHIEAMLRLLHILQRDLHLSLSVVFPLTELPLWYDIHQMYDEQMCLI